jgi:tRNA-Thr(GGU) m(6)t(6)A37 methyltransferase TsaA
MGDDERKRPMTFCFDPIGIVRSPYTDRFGIPRQAGLVEAAEGRVLLCPDYAREEAFRGLEGFSHVWLIVVFHGEDRAAGWKPTVRPPRLGGRTRVGVFASRAPHRPNPIGISAVEQLGLDRTAEGLCLRIRGMDLLNGTPVLDIKPYVPYADARPGARGGYAIPPEGAPQAVHFTPQALAGVVRADPTGEQRLRTLIEQVLAQDPRPGYMDRYPQRREFALTLFDREICWRLGDEGIEVWKVESVDSTVARRP